MTISQQALTQLQGIAASTTPVFLSGQDCAELGSAGLVQGHPDQPGSVPGTVLVTVTDAGTQLLAGSTNAAPTATKPTIAEVRVGVAVPAPKKRGGANNLTPRVSQYPFDGLVDPTVDAEGNPVCASFHVAAATDEEAKKLQSKLSSSVNQQNKKNSVDVTDEQGQVVLELKTKRSMLKDAEGNPVLDAQGKRQYNETQVSVPKQELTKRFIARRVNADDPDGLGVRVFRVPVDYKG